MKKALILFIASLFFILSACGTSNSAAKKTTSKTEATEQGLPPNVASNKYSKKRQKNKP